MTTGHHLIVPGSILVTFIVFVTSHHIFHFEAEDNLFSSKDTEVRLEYSESPYKFGLVSECFLKSDRELKVMANQRVVSHTKMMSQSWAQSHLPQYESPAIQNLLCELRALRISPVVTRLAV